MQGYIPRKGESWYYVELIPRGRNTYMKWRIQYRAGKGNQSTTTPFLAHFRSLLAGLELINQQSCSNENVKDYKQHLVPLVTQYITIVIILFILTLQVSKTSIALPSILPHRVATQGSRIVTRFLCAVERGVKEL